MFDQLIQILTEQLLPTLKTSGWFVLVLGILITVHELGHFLAAKLSGIRVDRFSIGFGRKIIGFRRGETEYWLSWIPLGGYVKMAGGDMMDEESTGSPDEYRSQPPMVRLRVILAGPAMNAVLAVVLTSVVCLLGVEIPSYFEDPPVVAFLSETGSAAAAGLQEGDRIRSLNGEPIETVEEVLDYLTVRPNETLSVMVDRDSRSRELTLEIRSDPETGAGTVGLAFAQPVVVGELTPGFPAQAAGFMPEDRILAIDDRELSSPYAMQEIIQDAGQREMLFRIERSGVLLERSIQPQLDPDTQRMMIGIAFGNRTVIRRYPLVAAIGQGFQRNWSTARSMVRFLVNLVLGTAPTRSLGGPILIAQATGAAARLGLVPLLAFISFISLNLAIVNLLPIPILDGGQFMLLLPELILGRPLKERTQMWAYQIGLVMLAGIMILVFYNDIRRLLPF